RDGQLEFATTRRALSTVVRRIGRNDRPRGLDLTPSPGQEQGHADDRRNDAGGGPGKAPVLEQRPDRRHGDEKQRLSHAERRRPSGRSLPPLELEPVS